MIQVEHQTEKGTVLFHKVEDEGKIFSISNFNKSDRMFISVMKGNSHWVNDHLLPIGNWQLIGLTSEVTEEQAKMMMPCISTAQLEGLWYSIGNNKPYSFDNALAAFNYLLEIKNIKTPSVVLLKYNYI